MMIDDEKVCVIKIEKEQVVQKLLDYFIYVLKYQFIATQFKTIGRTFLDN